MNDDRVSDCNEQDLKQRLSKGMGESPRLAQVVNLGRQRQRLTSGRVIPALAASLILVLLLSSLQIPHLARAIAELPLVGSAYEEVIKRTRMDLAYEAGLTGDIHRVVEAGDMKLTLLGAYADPMLAGVVFRLEWPEGTPSEVVENGRFDLSLELLAHRRFRWPWQEPTYRWSTGATWSQLYDEDEDALYVSYRTHEPIPWRVSRLTLQVGKRPWGQSAELTFPVQRLSSNDYDVIDINHALLEGDLLLRRLIFTPAQTRLEVDAKEGIFPRISVADESGNELRMTAGGGRLSSPKKGRDTFHSDYAATDSQEFTIELTGYYIRQLVILPLKVGAKAEADGVKVQIASIEVGETSSDITLRWEDPAGKYQVDHLTRLVTGRDNHSVSPAPTWTQADDQVVVHVPFRIRDEHISGRWAYRLQVGFGFSEEAHEVITVRR